MDRYSKAKIYKIVCNTTGKIYIGSTCEKTLAHRLSKHKYDYKRYLDGNRTFITSFDIIKNNNYDIVLLEDCENIQTKDQLYAREIYHIENNECLNKVIPTRTRKQYCYDNREKIKECKKKYYEENKLQEINRAKKFYEQNKTRILENRKEKVKCDLCNCEFTKFHLTIHNKSKKHQQALTEKI